MLIYLNLDRAYRQACRTSKRQQVLQQELHMYIQGTVEDTLLKESIEEVTNNSSICLITRCAINAHLNNRRPKKVKVTYEGLH